MSDVSSVTSHFATAHEGFNTTTSSPTNSGANTVGLASVTDLVNGSIFVGVIEPGQAKEQVFTGIVDTGGSQITDVVWTKGTNVAHSIGVSIVDYDTGTSHNMLVKGILVQHKQDGTHANTITTNTINENTGGNGVTVDGVNIKDGALNTANAVTTASITDDVVTDAKLIFGKLRYRKGGSATDWTSPGTNDYDYSGTNTFMQIGVVSCTAGSNTVTFPVAFTKKPIVIASTFNAGTVNAFTVCKASDTTTTQTNIYQIQAGGSSSTTEIAAWFAFGE